MKQPPPLLRTHRWRCRSSRHCHGDRGNVRIQAAIVQQESASILRLFYGLWDTLLAYERLCFLQKGDSLRMQTPTPEDSERIADFCNSEIQADGLLEENDGAPDVLQGIDNPQERGNL